ncbi:hypothetical protein FRC17_007869, partial [Serendipita sp. 399]
MSTADGSTETLNKRNSVINVPNAENTPTPGLNDDNVQSPTIKGEGQDPEHSIGEQAGTKDTSDSSNNPIAAAAADRDLAVRVWVASANRDDEVRDALGRMIAHVEELAQLLRNALKAQTDLENTLTVTRSNLALALSNNEMLEEALKRDASGRKVDVGWNRSTSSLSGPSPVSATPLQYQHYSPQPSLQQKNETGFFKFLRGNNQASSPRHVQTDSSGSARLHTPNSSIDLIPVASPGFVRAQHGLTSPSMPSLHATNQPMNSLSRREEELLHALEREKASTNKALTEKQKLEEELENLSQALFEEANRMVATERRQRAQIEEELHTARQEREALKGALRIVEGENTALRVGNPLPPTVTALSTSKDRPRGLTINTERQNLSEEQPHGGVKASQTPPTSELPN